MADPGFGRRVQGDEAERRVRRFTRGTTHISVHDREGNAAAWTSSNGEGSGYVVPGTGIHLNNMLGEDDLHPEGFHADPPGQRVASMMLPTMLVRDGSVRMVAGSGGSKRIRTALLQVILHVVDLGLSLREAVERHPLQAVAPELPPGLQQAISASGYGGGD